MHVLRLRTMVVDVRSGTCANLDIVGDREQRRAKQDPQLLVLTLSGVSVRDRVNSIKGFGLG